MQVNTVLLLGIIIFFITSILFLILWLDSKTNKISSENCPKVLSNYALIPNVDPGILKPQYTCGANPNGAPGTSLCTFNGITSLSQATSICGLYTNNQCNGFAYNNSTNTMTIINTGYAIDSTAKVTDQNFDVYLKQANT